MLRDVVEPIVRAASNFQHISILQGTKIYDVHLHPIPIPARERDARRDHQNFFFDQEAYVREMGAKHGFTMPPLLPPFPFPVWNKPSRQERVDKRWMALKRCGGEGS
jgi:hypothetical protein